MKPRFQKWATYLLVADILPRSETSSYVIANAIGEKRGNVQWCCLLANLPSYVQKEYRKLFLQGPKTTPVRVADIKPLFAAYNKSSHENAYREFCQLWRTILIR